MESFQIGDSMLFAPLFVFVAICKLCLWIKVIYLQRGTLSSVPGPKWAAWTRLWIVKTLASGESAERFVKVNKNYGK